MCVFCKHQKSEEKSAPMAKDWSVAEFSFNSCWSFRAVKNHTTTQNWYNYEKIKLSYSDKANYCQLEEGRLSHIDFTLSHHSSISQVDRWNMPAESTKYICLIKAALNEMCPEFEGIY